MHTYICSQHRVQENLDPSIAHNSGKKKTPPSDILLSVASNENKKHLDPTEPACKIGRIKLRPFSFFL